MDSNEERSSPAKSIAEAVADGTLVDVSSLAKRVGIPYAMFMTPHMVAKYEAQGPKGLYENVRFFANCIDCYSGQDSYGPVDCGDHYYIFEPHEEYGHVAIIVEYGKLESLGVKRMTGDRRQYAM